MRMWCHLARHLHDVPSTSSMAGPVSSRAVWARVLVVLCALAGFSDALFFHVTEGSQRCYIEEVRRGAHGVRLARRVYRALRAIPRGSAVSRLCVSVFHAPVAPQPRLCMSWGSLRQPHVPRVRVQVPEGTLVLADFKTPDIVPSTVPDTPTTVRSYLGTRDPWLRVPCAQALTCTAIVPGCTGHPNRGDRPLGGCCAEAGSAA